MEVLSDILRAMRVAGSVYFCERLSAPWSQEFGDPAHASFHLVRKGECFLNSGGTEERSASRRFHLRRGGPQAHAQRLGL